MLPFAFRLENSFVVLDAFLALGFLHFDGNLFGHLDALVVRIAGLALGLVLGGALDGPVVATRTVTVRAPASYFDQLV